MAEKDSSMKRNRIIGKTIIYALLILAALFIILPLLFLVLNSFKGQSEIVRNPIALPESWSLQYILSAIRQINFGKALLITVGITIGSLIPVVAFSSVAAWIITRHQAKISNFVYLMFVAAMLVPFQVIMYPLMNIMDSIGLKNQVGLVLMYTGFHMAMSVFLYSSAIRSVPVALEEAAFIDGANIFQIFFLVVFPLIKSTTVTVIILTGIAIWNDYLLPFLTLGTSSGKTLVLELYYAKMTSGQYGSPWELVFPAVLVCSIPLIIVFLCLQKHFVAGMTEGAVK